MATRSRIRRTLGCGGVLGAIILLSAAAAWTDSQLVDSTLAYCFGDFGAGEALASLIWLGGRWLIFMAVFLFGALLVAAFRALGKRAGDRAAVVAFRAGLWLGVVVLVAGPVALILYDFATTGTPTGVRGINCGAENVPPWWPAWLPS
ncbi:hypothetical protein [Streptosporangium sp. NPDC087985]|uniref:hypothetical protein n=1 Tax=Streptosporangium sp. NPDC087985 TaxID=3366196 RepID=UPI00380087CB